MFFSIRLACPAQETLSHFPSLPGCHERYHPASTLPGCPVLIGWGVLSYSQCGNVAQSPQNKKWLSMLMSEDVRGPRSLNWKGYMCNVRRNNAIDETWQLMLAVGSSNAIECLWWNIEESLFCSITAVYTQVECLFEDYFFSRDTKEYPQLVIDCFRGTHFAITATCVTLLSLLFHS